MPRPDYPRAKWYGAYHGNYSRASRPSSNRINKIVIHCVNGSWSSAINWFNDPRATVSAHYTIRSSDGFIGQSVEENDIAHHAGNWPVNQTSIGIEHEGYGNNPSRWFTPEMYNASARLTAHLCKKYNIPIRIGNANKSGILAHRQATSTYCPGRWNFARYLKLVRIYHSRLNDRPRKPRKFRMVVDNSNANRFRAPASWKVSSWSGQRYGRNYRYTNPAKASQPAMYKFRIPKRGRYIVWARWPADPGYNNRAQFMIWTANGWARRVVNQRVRGGRWVRLGVFTLRPGNYWTVRQSRVSRGKGLIIADAVYIREA